MELTHLSFADDMIIFIDGSAESMDSVVEVQNSFEGELGLAINMSNSALHMAGRNHHNF